MSWAARLVHLSGLHLIGVICLVAAFALIRMLLGLWMTGQLVLVAIAVIDPRLAATFARLSFLGVGGVGALIIMFMAARGRDRALALVPLWMLFLVWVFGAAVIATGRLATDIAVSGLISGLVLIVLVIGFTVTQFAFRSQEPIYGLAAPSDQQRSALAVDGAGNVYFADTQMGAGNYEVTISVPRKPTPAPSPPLPRP